MVDWVSGACGHVWIAATDCPFCPLMKNEVASHPPNGVTIVGMDMADGGSWSALVATDDPRPIGESLRILLPTSYRVGTIKTSPVEPYPPVTPEIMAPESLFGKMIDHALMMGIAATKDGRLITREEMYMRDSSATPDALDDFFTDCRRGDGRSLQRELDTANAQVRLREGTIERQHKALLEAQEREIALRTELMTAHDRAAAQNAAIMELTDKLARFTAANVQPIGAKPVANPFHQRELDRRRMGPEGI